MPFGKIKSFSAERGYGFIEPDDGSADVFMHITKVVDDRPVQAGQRVSYELAIEPRTGQARADQVRFVDRASAA